MRPYITSFAYSHFTMMIPYNVRYDVGALLWAFRHSETKLEQDKKKEFHVAHLYYSKDRLVS